MTESSHVWRQFIHELMGCLETVSPETAAVALRRYTQSAHADAEAATVDGMAAVLGIKVVSKVPTVDARNAVIRPAAPISRVAPPYRIELGLVGSSLGRRREFLLAHELGHWVLDRLLERTLFSKQGGPQDWSSPAAQEVFARIFAQTLLEPVMPTLATEIQEIEKGFSTATIDSVALWRVNDGPMLTVMHLKEMARMECLSIRHVISRLQQKALLEQTQTGILVYRQMANQHTLCDKGIRLWQNSLPPWGFLPMNQRGWRHGMTGLLDIHLTGKHFRTEFHTETGLKVQERSASGAKPLFRQKMLSTVRCATTPIDVTTEGRFLVTMFTWPRPADWKHE